MTPITLERLSALILALCMAFASSLSLFAAPGPLSTAPDQGPALGYESYPLLGNLGPGDPIYIQQQEQLAASYEAIKAGRKGPDLVLYRYEAKSSVDIFSLAARFNLPYETIASLNRIDRSRPIVPGEKLLIPSAPGLFVAEKQASDLDYLLSYRSEAGEDLVVSGLRGSEGLRFLRGEHFNSEERALFLGALFRLPLAPSARLTSSFGPRVNPVTGVAGVHKGIDLAAAYGSEVYAARDGVVVESGSDPVLGEYIVIRHEGGWQTVYGHLSKRLARLNDHVESGMIIGRVGSTGQSTGPHLHFEVRNHGEARDPATLIPKVKR
jgi:murein DD-endopeptidase MepM/ murein hydrolase activator NlpD